MDFALVLTVKQLKLYVVKASKIHCLGSYNLTLNNEQIRCDRYATETTSSSFCKAYYNLPTCTNMSQIQKCESRQQTSYPVSMTYFSDGRTENGTDETHTYFRISPEFIECPKGEESTTQTTTRTPRTELVPRSTVMTTGLRNNTSIITASLVDGQCGDAATDIVGGSGEILSPNYSYEYGHAANCSWNFSPKKGKDFALVLTVKQLILYAVKYPKSHCLGSYNLTLNNEQTKCDRFAHENYSSRPFCKAYYSSPTCTNIRQIQNCESRQQTSYPVSMTYFSDGRTENGIRSTKMYFRVAYEFINCSGASLVDGQCGDAATDIVGGSGEIYSTNYYYGGEYGHAANCSWNFSPKKGKDFALVLTVNQLYLFVAKSSKRHCLGSYNLTLNNERIRCDRHAFDTARNPSFCKAYYNSPTCTNMSQIQKCESKQQTSFPVSMTYFSDGRTDNSTYVTSDQMYFRAVYEFIECSGGEDSTTPTTTRAPRTELVPSSIVMTTGWNNTSTASAAFPASTSTIIIALVAVIVLLVAGGIIGGICFYRRLKSPANGRSQRGEEGQPTNAIPDVDFHTYEEIRPRVLTEKPGYEVPRPIEMPEEDEVGDAIPDVEEDEGGYVVPNIFQQGESSREAEYEEAIQHPEPDYIEPETVRKKPQYVEPETVRTEPETVRTETEYDEPGTVRKEPENDEPGTVRKEPECDEPGTVRKEPENDEPGTVRKEPEYDEPGTVRKEPENDEPGTVRKEPEYDEPGMVRKEPEYDEPGTVRKEPENDEPETVRKEPNLRLMAKFKNPQKAPDPLSTTSNG